jgi:hypothetical protein
MQQVKKRLCQRPGWALNLLTTVFQMRSSVCLCGHEKSGRASGHAKCVCVCGGG